MCLVRVYVFFYKLTNTKKSIIILFEGRESSLMWSNKVRLTVFDVFTKVS